MPPTAHRSRRDGGSSASAPCRKARARAARLPRAAQRLKGAQLSTGCGLASVRPEDANSGFTPLFFRKRPIFRFSDNPPNRA